MVNGKNWKQRTYYYFPETKGGKLGSYVKSKLKRGMLFYLLLSKHRNLRMFTD